MLSGHVQVAEVKFKVTGGNSDKLLEKKQKTKKLDCDNVIEKGNYSQI